MEFSEKRIEQLRNMPIIESKVKKSNDGKFIMHKTIITDIKPVNYYEAILNGNLNMQAKEDINNKEIEEEKEED